MKETWVLVAALAALSACTPASSRLAGKWAVPEGDRAFEFKSDGTMTELSKVGLRYPITIKGSGTWNATKDTLTWTEATVEMSSPLPEGVSAEDWEKAQTALGDQLKKANASLEEEWKKPKKWLYAMPDKNTMKLTGEGGTILPLVRVPND